MNIPRPHSISPIHAPAHQELGLRPLQRVTAQILAVTGSTALLTIDGFPMVAQLPSADQAMALLAEQTAQFIVTQVTNGKVTLKIVKNAQSQAPRTGSIFNGPELAVRLLEQHNIPATVNNLMLARSALQRRLPVTKGLLNELLGALSDSGSWGSSEAELAAALKASGLPVNAKTLSLASRQAAQIGDSIARLIAVLANAAGTDLPEDLLKQLNLNLQMLDRMVLKGDAQTSQIAEQLKVAVEMLGKSLESVLLDQSQNPVASSPEKGLLSLVRLQQLLEHIGKNEVAGAIAEFLGDLRLSQFLNAKPDRILGQEEWSEIDFVIQSAQQKAHKEFSSARLRIARESRPDSAKINSACAHLILQVDLEPGRTVEVDLSVVGKQIKTSMSTSDSLWCQQAQRELPTLDEALQSLGFALIDAEIITGHPQPSQRLAQASSGMPLMTVNIEV